MHLFMGSSRLYMGTLGIERVASTSMRTLISWLARLGLLLVIANRCSWTLTCGKWMALNY